VMSRAYDVEGRLPRCFFLDSREECSGELTLDTTTLKEVWGDRRVPLALASMLKAVLEGRISSEKSTDDTIDGGGTVAVDDEEDENTEEAEDPFDEEKESRLALVEVFECFCSGMTPLPRSVHVLDVNSLINRKHELSKARSMSSSSEEAEESPEILPPPVLLRCVKDGEDPPKDGLVGEEEAVSKLLDAVCTIRRKHKLPPLEVCLPGVNTDNDDHAMTFGIVATDRSSNNKRRDPEEEEWLLVGRESATQTVSEDSVYPIRSIYSFFVVLNSDSVVQSTPSPNSVPDESEESTSGSSTTSASDNDDVVEDDGIVQQEHDHDNEHAHEQGQAQEQEQEQKHEHEQGQEEQGQEQEQGPSTTDSSVFAAVKQHEDSAWSILAAIHVTGPEAIDGTADGNAAAAACPDLVVVDDPLCIINEYVRYLQGDDAPPRTGGRKRRRVHVHEDIIDRRMCRIRILTTGSEPPETDAGSVAEQREKRQQLLQARLLKEQQELLQVLEQKLRELQKSQELESAVPSTETPESSP